MNRLFLFFAMLATTTLCLNAQNRSTGGAQIDFIKESSMIPLVIKPEARQMRLPYAVDNSTRNYMPPIFDQGFSSSCVQCAEIGYVFTYEQNRLRNLAAGTSWYGTDSVANANLYHPFFTYNFLNDGNGSNFTYYSNGFDIVANYGCPDLIQYYDTILNQYYDPSTNQLPFRRWMSGKEKYISAYDNIIATNQTGESAYVMNWESGLLSDLDDIKTWLYNHNSDTAIGGLAIISVFLEDNDDNVCTIPEGTPEGGKKMLTSWGGLGHALTIVGYNDSICCFDLNNDSVYENTDLNENGVIDLSECERGAFKVANSWGTSWGDSGYIYVPYYLLSTGMQLNRAYTCMATEQEEKTVFLSYEISYPLRNQLFTYIGKASNAASQNIESSAKIAMLNYDTSFYRTGGGLPMNGNINHPGPIMIGLNFGHWFNPNNNLCGKYFIKILGGMSWANPSDSAFIRDFSLIDYRWGETFELKCADTMVFIQSDDTSLSIPYDLLPFEIVENHTCATDKVARRDVEIGDNSTFSVQSGVHVDMYGTDSYDCRLTVNSGSSLVIADSAFITAKRGICQIVINGNVQIGQDVVFRAENDAVFSIIVNNNEYFNVSGCTFDNVELTINAPLSYTNTPVANIGNCKFTATKGTLNHAIRVSDYPVFSIDGNEINGTDTLGIGHYADGVMAYYSGASQTTSVIDGNDIKGCNNSGLLLYSSNADVTMNRISECGYGVKFLNLTTISKFSGNCGSPNADNTQAIQDFDTCGICIYRYSMPQTIQYNYITSSETAPFIVYNYEIPNTDVRPIHFIIDVERNNWGPYTNAQVESRLAFTTNGPHTATYDFMPRWRMGECPYVGGEKGAKRMMAEADSIWNENANYQEVASLLKDVVKYYPTTNSAATALKMMYSLAYCKPDEYTNLLEYYKNDTTIKSNTNLSLLASILCNKCDETMGHYDKALDWYKKIIQDKNTSRNDSIFAVVDLGHLLLKMRANAGKASLNNIAEYSKQSDNCLRNIGVDIPVRDDGGDFPEEYWSDIVTEQPEGYVVGDNGDVDIYTPEGMAWLISTTRGLNGQEPYTYEGHTIRLKKNIDMSDALWQTLSTDEDYPFMGVFDGCSHSITGLLPSNSTNFSLFHKMENAKLERLTMICDCERPYQLMQFCYVPYLDNSIIDRCIVLNNPDKSHCLPSLVWFNNDSHITNCLLRGNGLLTGVSSGYTKGAWIAYYNNSESLIENCHIVHDTLYGSITDGFAANENEGTIRNCYSYVNMVANAAMGNGLPYRKGVVATNSDSGCISHCYYNKCIVSYYSTPSNECPVTDDFPYSSFPHELIGEVDWTGPFDKSETDQTWSLAETEIIYNTGGSQFVIDTIDWQTGWDNADITLIDALNEWVDEKNENGGDYVNWVYDNDSIFGLPILDLPSADNDTEGIKKDNVKSNISSLYPNPSKDIVFIDNAEGEWVRIYDNTGRVVKETQYKNGISISGLSHGVYAATVSNRVVKFVKE